MVRDRANITFAIKSEVIYLESHGAIAPNAVHHDLDLHFQGHTIRNASIWKTDREGEKYSTITCIDVDIE